MHFKSAATLAFALLTITGAGSAFAAGNEAVDEAKAIGSASIKLADAIALVEAKGTGKAVEAALLTDGSTAAYQITTLLPDGTETTYAVDVQTGAVVATVDANNETGDDQEQADEGNQDGPNGDGDGETQDDAGN